MKTTEHIEGWYASYPLNDILPLISSYQVNTGECGNIGEIGVHHGKMALFMFQLLQGGEAGIAVDLFGNQEENTDKSGLGSLGAFNKHAGQILGAGWRNRIDVLTANSNALLPEDLTPRVKNLNTPKFRMFSVDGGHTISCVLQDLELISKIMTQNGVIIVDDYHHMGWQGVQDGTDLFLRRHPEWVPFYVSPLVKGANKLILCRKESQAAYLTVIPYKQHLNWYDPTKPKESMIKPKQDKHQCTPSFIWSYTKAKEEMKK